MSDLPSQWVPSKEEFMFVYVPVIIKSHQSIAKKAAALDCERLTISH